MRQDTRTQQQQDFEQGGCRFFWAHAAVLFEAAQKRLREAEDEERRLLLQGLQEMMAPFAYDEEIWNREGRFVPKDGLDEHPFVLRRWFPLPYPL